MKFKVFTFGVGSLLNESLIENTLNLWLAQNNVKVLSTSCALSGQEFILNVFYEELK